MPDPKKKDPLWKRAIDKILGVVPLKESYSPFAEKNMAKVLTPAEAQERKKQGLFSVYGKAETIKEGRRAYNRDESLLLPNYSDENGWYMPHPSGNAYQRAGFSPVPVDAGGYPLPGAVPQTYTTPATHTGRNPTPQEYTDTYRDYLASLYDAKKRRGEAVGDIDTFITQGLTNKARAVEDKNLTPTGSEKFPLKQQPANQGAKSDGKNSTRTSGGGSK